MTNTEKFNYTKWGFLLSTSIAIFTLVAGVTVPEIRRLIGLESKAGVVQKQDVELITLTETGEPLGGVRIQVISQGAPEFTWTGDTGFATVKIPSKGNVTVILSKEGYLISCTYRINSEKADKEYKSATLEAV